MAAKPSSPVKLQMYSEDEGMRRDDEDEKVPEEDKLGGVPPMVLFFLRTPLLLPFPMDGDLMGWVGLFESSFFKIYWKIFTRLVGEAASTWKERTRREKNERGLDKSLRILLSPHSDFHKLQQTFGVAMQYCKT